MHKADTTVGWRKQYEGIDIVIPSAPEFENHSLLWDDTLALVPPYKRNVGDQTPSARLGFLKQGRKQQARQRGLISVPIFSALNNHTSVSLIEEFS
jgi:hypothetical protein